MSKVYRQHISVDDLEWCCGVYNSGEYEMQVREDAIKNWSTGKETKLTEKEGYYKSKKQAAKKALKDAISEAGGRPIIFWFVRERDYDDKMNDDYASPELRELVSTHKEVTSLGTFVNPGTRNHIDGYLITTNTEKVT